MGVFGKMERMQRILSLPHPDIVMLAQLAIHLAHFLHRRKCQRKVTLELAQVVLIIQQHGHRGKAVAPAAPRLLKVGLQRVGEVQMGDETHVGLVNTHTEGVGGHHHADAARHPVVLPLVAHFGIHAGMVAFGGHTVLGEKLRHLRRLAAVAHIHDARARITVGNPQKPSVFILLFHHKIGEVFPFETLSEHILGREP